MREGTKDALGLQPAVPSEIHTCVPEGNAGHWKELVHRPGFKFQLLLSCVTLDKTFSLLSLSILM